MAGASLALVRCGAGCGREKKGRHIHTYVRAAAETCSPSSRAKRGRMIALKACLLSACKLKIRPTDKKKHLGVDGRQRETAYKKISLPDLFPSPNTHSTPPPSNSTQSTRPLFTLLHIEYSTLEKKRRQQNYAM